MKPLRWIVLLLALSVVAACETPSAYDMDKYGRDSGGPGGYLTHQGD